MSSLIYFLIISSVLEVVHPKSRKKVDVDVLFQKPENDYLKKWGPKTGTIFTTGVALDKTTSPYTLAIHVVGNGVTDELYVRVNSLGEARNLKLYSNDDYMLVELPTHSFTAISKTAEPNHLIVIENGKCTKRNYDKHEAYKPSKKSVKHPACKEIITTLGQMKQKTAYKRWYEYSSLFEDPDGDIIKWLPHNGPVFTTVISIDKSTFPYVLEMFMSGNGVKDVLLAQIYNIRDARNIQMFNTDQLAILEAPAHRYTAVSRVSEPATMMVIEDGKCTKRTYDPNDPSSRVKEEAVDPCTDTIELVESSKKNNAPVNWYIPLLIFEDPDEKFLKWPSFEGPTFTNSIALDKSITPHILGIFISGNGVTDELHVKVNSAGEARKLLVYNTEDVIILTLPSRNYAAMGLAGRPKTLTIIENGKCTKRKYDENRSVFEPEEETLDDDRCEKTAKSLEAVTKKINPVKWHTLFFEDPDGELIKWPAYKGPMYMSGVALDKSKTPHTLGMFISGNAITDELHVKLDKASDARHLLLHNNEDHVILLLPDYSFGAFSRSTEPGTLIVIENGKCTSKKYNRRERTQRPSEKVVDRDECVETVNLVENAKEKNVPIDWYILFNEDPDSDLKKWPPYKGPTYTTGISLDKSKRPFNLGMYVSGNGVTDELHLRVKNAAEARKLRVYNNKSVVAFVYPAYNFAALSKDTEPGSVYVVVNGKCTKRRHDASDTMIRLPEETVDEEVCQEIKDMLEDIEKKLEPVPWGMLFFEDPDEDTKKWPPYQGPTFLNGIVLDKTTTPFTLGMYVSGNGIEEELYVNLNDASEARQLLVFNNEDQMVLNFPTKDFSVTCKKADRGTLIMNENGKCRIMKYDENKPSVVVSNDEQDKDACKESIESMNKFMKDSEPIDWYTLFFEDADEKLKKWPPLHGPTFMNAISLDKIATPYKLGLFASGNGVEDELYVKVDKARDAANLQLYNTEDEIIFHYPSQKYSAVSRKAEPGTVTVIANDQCTLRTYDQNNPRLRTTVKIDDQDRCKQITKSVDDVVQKSPSIKWYTLYYEDEDNNLSHYPLHKGPLYVFGVSLDKITSPYTLGVYVSGNGVSDELYMKVDKASDARELSVYSEEDQIIFSLPTHKYIAFSKKTEPGKLIVIEDNKCTIREYDAKNPMLKLREEGLDDAACNDHAKWAKDTMEASDSVQWHSLFYEDADKQLKKWPPYNGPLFKHGIVLDKGTRPYTLAMYMSGNGIEDELISHLKTKGDVRKVLVFNLPDLIIFDLWTHKLSAISTKSNPSILDVINGGECKRSKFDVNNPAVKLSIDSLDDETCKKRINLVKEVKENVPSLKWYHLFSEEQDESLVQWPPYSGPTFVNGVSLDMSKKPFDLGMYIYGNGVEDEFRVKVKSFGEARNLNIYNNIQYNVLSFPKLKIDVISSETDPGSLVRIIDGFCIRNVYDKKSVPSVPTELWVDENSCKKIMSLVNQIKKHNSPIDWYILFYENLSNAVLKWPAHKGPTFTTGVALDTSSEPMTLGMFVSGNGVLDELHVGVDRVSDVRNLLVYNTEDSVVFIPPSRDPLVLGLKSEPENIYLTNKASDHTFKRKVYLKDNPRVKLPEEQLRKKKRCLQLKHFVKNMEKNAVPVKWWVLHFENHDDIFKYPKYFGPTFMHAVSLETGKGKGVNTLAVYFSGNGVTDELHVHVDKTWEARKLRIYNNENHLLLIFPDHKILAISQKINPGTLVVIKDNECKRREYKNGNEIFYPDEEAVDGKTCKEAMKLVKEIELNEVPVKWHILYYDEKDENLLKWAPIRGSAYMLAISLDSSLAPNTLGMFVSGNGVKDELYLKINNTSDARKLLVYDSEDKIIFTLPSHSFAAIAKKSEPNTLIVIKIEKCTRRKYDAKSIFYSPQEENVDDKTCAEYIYLVEKSKKEEVPLRWYLLYAQKPDSELMKWPPYDGLTFRNAFALDLSTTPYTFGLSISSKDVLDELYVKVEKQNEVRKLLVYNNEDRTILILPTQRFSVIALKTEPGSLTVIENNRCKTRKSNSNDLMPEEEITGEDVCNKKMEMVLDATQHDVPVRWSLLQLQGNDDDVDIFIGHNGPIYENGVALDKSTTPYTLGMYVNGNGVTDEFYVEVDKTSDARRLQVYNNEHRLVFNFPDKSFAVVCKKTEPSTSIVIENGKCTRRKYGETYNIINPKEEEVDENTCNDVIKMVDKVAKTDVPLRTFSLFHENQDDKLMKWLPFHNGLYVQGVSLDKITTPITLGMYIKGNGVEDELHVKLEKEEDLRDLLILNTPDMIAFNLPSYNISATALIEEPGNMTVIQNEKCKVRKYNDNKSFLHVELDLGKEDCNKAKRLVEGARKYSIHVDSHIYLIQNLEDYVLEMIKPPSFGGTFASCVILLKFSGSLKLGMFLAGNGIMDELHLDVDKKEDAANVEVYNNNDELVFKLPTHNFAAISKKTERGILMVIKDGKCTRRKYDTKFPMRVPIEEEMDVNTCTEVTDLVEQFQADGNPGESYIFYFEDPRKEGNQLSSSTSSRTNPFDSSNLLQAESNSCIPIKPSGWSITGMVKKAWNFMTKPAPPKNDKEVIKRPPLYGSSFTSGVILDKSTSPFKLGIFISGTGIMDELHVGVSSMEEAGNLEVYNGVNEITFNLQSHKFAVMGSRREPGVLTVVENDKCTKRIYNKKNPQYKPSEKPVDEETCIETINMVKYADPNYKPVYSDILFLEEPQDDVEVGTVIYGGLYTHCLLLDKRTTPYTIGIFVAGNGIIDELHVKIDIEDEFQFVQVHLEDNINIFQVATQNFAAIAKTMEPGKLLIIETDKCTMRTYNRKDPRQKPFERALDQETCSKSIDLVNERTLTAKYPLHKEHILYYKMENDKIKKYDPEYGSTFMHCIILDKSTEPYTIGVFVAGNDLIDELHFKVEDDKEVLNIDIHNRPEKIVFKYAAQEFVAFSRITEPGILIVVEKDKCTQRKYDEIYPDAKPQIEAFDFDECMSRIAQLEDLDLPFPSAKAKLKNEKEEKEAKKENENENDEKDGIEGKGESENIEKETKYENGAREAKNEG